MDILYIYNGYHNSEQLRYAMRSVATYGRSVGRVYLVGQIPDWVSDEVVCIPYVSDPTLYKENDITNAIFYAVRHSNIGKSDGCFLISGDDYFYIKETNFEHYPIYLKGELPEVARGHEDMGGWKYVESLCNTYKLLALHELPTRNYSQHAMFYAERDLMGEYYSLFVQAYKLKYGVVFDSLMSNLIVNKYGNENVKKRKDNKLTTINGWSDLIRQIGEEECFSTSDLGWKLGAYNLLKELFPQPSKYEKQ